MGYTTLADRYAIKSTKEDLLLDSIQSIAQRTAEEGESERAAIGSVMEALNAAKARGLIVGATSELSRGGYETVARPRIAAPSPA